MKTNVTLVALGLVLISIGLYRAFPPKVDSKFLWNNLPPIVALAIIGGLVWRIGDPSLIESGIRATMKTTSSFLITLVTLMPLIGFGAIIAHHYEAQLASALQGPFRYLTVTTSAFITPGGSAGSGIISRLWYSQPELRPMLQYFLCTTPMICFSIYMIRKLGLPDEIANAMYKTNWLIVLGSMPFFWVYEKFIFEAPPVAVQAVAGIVTK